MVKLENIKKRIEEIEDLIECVNAIKTEIDYINLKIGEHLGDSEGAYALTDEDAKFMTKVRLNEISKIQPKIDALLLTIEVKKD